MNERRGSWYLLTGLVIGVVLGVLYAWFIQPAPNKDVSPAALQAESKDQYRTMIAIAFVADGDLVRARARLELLHEADLYRALAEQAQRLLAAGKSAEDARALGILANALKQANPTK
jgi:uncharacterized membrane-anchored protein YhcB (DUF1043 family)